MLLNVMIYTLNSVNIITFKIICSVENNLI